MRFKRDMSVNTLLLNKKAYPAVQDFFRTVRSGDEDQAILLRSAKLASQ